MLVKFLLVLVQTIFQSGVDFFSVTVVVWRC